MTMSAKNENEQISNAVLETAQQTVLMAVLQSIHIDCEELISKKKQHLIQETESLQYEGLSLTKAMTLRGVEEMAVNPTGVLQEKITALMQPKLPLAPHAEIEREEVPVPSQPNFHSNGKARSRRVKPQKEVRHDNRE